MTNSGIYKILNQINKKEYYGSTIDFNKRFYAHFADLKINKHPNKHLQTSVNKYGIDNFLFMIVEYANESKLLHVEQKYLDVFWDGGHHCFNICSVAGSPLGYKHTPGAKEKMSEAKRKPRSQKHKDSISRAQTGKKRRPYKPRSQEHNDKIAKALTGKKHSQERNNKMSRIRAGKSGHKIAEMHLL